MLQAAYQKPTDERCQTRCGTAGGIGAPPHLGSPSVDDDLEQTSQVHSRVRSWDVDRAHRTANGAVAKWPSRESFDVNDMLSAKHE
jgi:hypothetical protein